MADMKLLPAAAPDCRFGVAKPGDLLPLKAPFLDWEVMAKLTQVRTPDPGVTAHYYDLFLFGVYVGMAKATSKNGKVSWESL